MVKKIIPILILISLITACETGKRKTPGSNSNKSTSGKTIEVDSYFGDIKCGEFFTTTLTAKNCTDEKCVWETSDIPSYIVVEEGEDYIKFSGIVEGEACADSNNAKTIIDVTACDSDDNTICGYGTASFEMEGSSTEGGGAGDGTGDGNGTGDGEEEVTSVKGSKNTVVIPCGQTVTSPKKAAYDVYCKSGTCLMSFSPELPGGLSAIIEKKEIRVSGKFEDIAKCGPFGEQEIGVTVCDSILLTECASSSFKLKTTPAKLQVTTASLGNGTIGTDYGTLTFEAEGGSGSYTWTDISKTVWDESCAEKFSEPCDDTFVGLDKAGLSVSTDGKITGVPNSVGNFHDIVLQVEDNITGTVAKSPPLSLTIMDNGGIVITLYKYDPSPTAQSKTTVTTTTAFSYENVTVDFSEELLFSVAGSAEWYKVKTFDSDISVGGKIVDKKSDGSLIIDKFIRPKKALKDGNLVIPSLTITITDNAKKDTTLTITNLTFKKDPCSNLEIVKKGETAGQYELKGATSSASVTWFAGSEKAYAGETVCAKTNDLKCISPSSSSSEGASCSIKEEDLNNFKGCDIPSSSSEEALTLKKTFTVKALVDGCSEKVSKKDEFKRDVPSLNQEYITAVHVVSEFENVDEYCKFWTKLIYGDQNLQAETKHVGLGNYEEKFLFYTSTNADLYKVGGKVNVDNNTILASSVKKINLIYDDNNDAWADMDYKTHAIILVTENYYYPILHEQDDEGEVDGNYKTEPYDIDPANWKLKCKKNDAKPATASNSEKSTFDSMISETCGEFDNEGLKNGHLNHDA